MVTSPSPLPLHAPRRVSILGATGSIGEQSANVIAAHAGRFEIHAVTAQQNAKKLAETAIRLHASTAVVTDDAAYPELKTLLSGTGITTAAGEQAQLEAAAAPVDISVVGITGFAGLAPTMAAIEAGNNIALANKECLVAAGKLVMNAAKKHGVDILPVDSEHNALFQIMQEQHRASLEHVTLTASGGPFRTWTKEQMASATPAQAVNHPNWNMGAKISVDSATMMNKGLEAIEAAVLFDLPPEAIKVLVHPQSIIHAMAHYHDGSVLAQMGLPDMHTPISLALGWPERLQLDRPRLNLAEIGQLEFEEPDFDRFPCLQLAFDAMKQGGIAPLALNAANEVAVAKFLNEDIPFSAIPTAIADIMHSIASDTELSSLSTYEDAHLSIIS